MSKRAWPDYAAVWRWHFYAGIFCIPFVIVLSVTGTIYLFRPQIEAWQEQKFDRLPVGATSAAPYADQVRSALAMFDGGKFAAIEKSTFAPSDGNITQATRVILERDSEPVATRQGEGRSERVRVYIDPAESRVLASVVDQDSFINVVKRIHGELLLGKRGSYVVELAASWTIVMVLTGLVLWLPAKLQLAGVVYPRLHRTGKTFWKDMHSVGGFWA